MEEMLLKIKLSTISRPYCNLALIPLIYRLAHNLNNSWVQFFYLQTFFLIKVQRVLFVLFPHDWEPPASAFTLFQNRRQEDKNHCSNVSSGYCFKHSIKFFLRGFEILKHILFLKYSFFLHWNKYTFLTGCPNSLCNYVVFKSPYYHYSICKNIKVDPKIYIKYKVFFCINSKKFHKTSLLA